MKKVLTFIVFPLLIVFLVYAIYASIQEPVEFDKSKSSREKVAIERLKDIRTLQVAYKSVYGKYTSSIDSLKDFYNNGNIKVVMQIGSNDDSLAVANTEALKRRRPRITPEQMYELYKEGQALVFRIDQQIPVKDTLFRGRRNFIVDSLAFIPFSGDSIIMHAEIRKVSGVNMPLFEALMPYDVLLQGLDRQLIINLKALREDTGRYPGVKVGDINVPNNNAGNWE